MNFEVLAYLNMFNEKPTSLSPFDIFIDTVTECVVQQLQEHLCRLLRPAALRGTPNFGLSLAADTTIEPTERYDLLLFNDILQKRLCPLKSHALENRNNRN